MATTYAQARPRTARKTEEARWMDGSTHAATGFLAGIGIGAALYAGGRHTGAQTVDDIARTACFGLTAMGLALLPDSDHHDASFAHAAGPLSWVLAHVIGLLFGGHRQGMHSIFGVALFCGLTELAVTHPSRWSLGILAAVLAICIAAGLKATRFARHHGEALVFGCAIAGLSVVLVRPDLWWLCALGMGLHIAEDELTGHGCALLWPVSRRRIGGDGRQPAADRTAQTAAAAAASKTARPVRTARTPKPEPARALTPKLEPGQKMAWVSDGVCLACATRAHGDCDDKTCGCLRGQHPSRPGWVSPVPRAVVPLPETPPF